MTSLTDLDLVEIRRDLHAYPEVGWTEFRTTALVAEELASRGFTLHLGKDALDVDERLGTPPGNVIEEARERARTEGAPGAYLDRLAESTGLVSEKIYGDGPVVGVRVDVDALGITEASDDDHRPAREGFASRHPGEMHACGHDGHTAIGVGVAREIDERGGFDGTLRLFFQPAEEGSRGGKAMSATDHVRTLDHVLALHLGLGVPTGTVVAGFTDPLPNARLEVTFEGRESHAANAPQEGRNALLAAATAVQGLYALPRHAGGVTRVNVGELHVSTPENVVAGAATMRVEVRGETATVNEFLLDRAREVLEGAAAMHGVEVTTALYGTATTFVPDKRPVEAVAAAANASDDVTEVDPIRPFGASEDASHLIRRVQEGGGTGTYVGIGSTLPSGHHTPRFDVDEDALSVGVEVIADAIRAL